jgi:hypothetical protein
MAILRTIMATLANPFYGRPDAPPGPSTITGGILTVFQFVLLIFGVGIFTWAHPDLATVLFLVVLSRLLWKWSS